MPSRLDLSDEAVPEAPAPADLPPIVVAEPGSESPRFSREQWAEGVVAFGRAQGARVPTYQDLLGFLEDRPGWGLLAFLIPGVEVQLCPIASLGPGVEPTDALRGLLTDHLDELTVDQRDETTWTAHALGLHETGAVIIQDAIAMQRGGATVVVMSMAHSTLVAAVMQERLAALAGIPSEGR